VRHCYAPRMTEPGPAVEPEDEGYRSLLRQLYWSNEAGARPRAGTEQIREDMIEFVAKMRTDERASVPLGEPHLSAQTAWKRKAKYTLFRSDRLLADAMDLSGALAERVVALEREVASLKGASPDEPTEGGNV
jgi:hypothetical protein